MLQLMGLCSALRLPAENWKELVQKTSLKWQELSSCFSADRPDIFIRFHYFFSSGITSSL